MTARGESAARVAGPLTIALALAVVGCRPDAPDDAKVASAAPTTQESSVAPEAVPPAPSASSATLLSEPEAVQRVLASAAAKHVLAKHGAYGPVLERAGKLLFITLAPTEPEERVAYPKFRIDRRTGKMEAESLCEEGGWVTTDRRDFEQRALDRAFELPEVRGLGRQLGKASGGRVRLTLRIESCAKHAAGDDSRRVQLYVGEAHDDHTVRTFTLRVEGPDLAVSVADMGANEFVPHATWTKGARARGLR